MQIPALPPASRKISGLASIRVLENLTDVNPSQWDRLTQGHPLLSYAFLNNLHVTGCASPQTGWLPRFVTAWRNDELIGAFPLYLKTHSYGEYVFDWAWADAYQRHGLDYYPKLLSAIPFTPVSGPRLLANDAETRYLLIESAMQLARRHSSFHCLFPKEAEAREWEKAGLMLRQGVQFHWKNQGYSDFDDFLNQLAHDKRKKIRQERRRVREAGVSLRRLCGQEISGENWRFFAKCYNLTYRAHHSTPYLSLEFFERLGDSMPENLLLVLAEKSGHPVASSLNVFNRSSLFGRYWGAVAHIPMLHFEVCYYQSLEFCIERGISVFEGGAQGEHKLARGFLPVKTWSAHWLKHPQFSSAIEEFLHRETAGIERYVSELNDHTPFKNHQNPDST